MACLTSAKVDPLLVPRQPREENLRLRALLDETGMSNKGLARRVVDLAAIQGVANVRCDHTSVLRWLAGEQPRPPVPELLGVMPSRAVEVATVSVQPVESCKPRSPGKPAGRRACRLWASQDRAR